MHCDRYFRSRVDKENKKRKRTGDESDEESDASVDDDEFDGFLGLSYS